MEIGGTMEKFFERFEKYPNRHPNLDMTTLKQKLTKFDEDRIMYMEETGGEPSVIYDKQNNRYLVIDTSVQSPDRRSCCYDGQARINRKKFPPETSAMELAEQNGVKLVDETIYHLLQSYVVCDTKTSSWIATPEDIRTLGGALFGDNKYGRTFIYHNGADSYYGARGFRCYFELE